jgi:hypothetical protein
MRSGCRVENVELVDGALEKTGRKAGALALPELLRLLVAKAFNHPMEQPSACEIIKR